MARSPTLRPTIGGAPSAKPAFAWALDCVAFLKADRSAPVRNVKMGRHLPMFALIHLMKSVTRVQRLRQRGARNAAGTSNPEAPLREPSRVRQQTPTPVIVTIIITTHTISNSTHLPYPLQYTPTTYTPYAIHPYQLRLPTNTDALRHLYPPPPLHTLPPTTTVYPLPLLPTPTTYLHGHPPSTYLTTHPHYLTQDHILPRHFYPLLRINL